MKLQEVVLLSPIQGIMCTDYRNAISCLRKAEMLVAELIPRAQVRCFPRNRAQLCFAGLPQEAARKTPRYWCLKNVCVSIGRRLLDPLG